MICFKKILVFFLCLLNFSNCIDTDCSSTTSGCPNIDSSTSNKYFVLRNPSTGLVLDSSEGWVTTQQFTGFTTQLWKLEPFEKGMVYIVNKHDGKVLGHDMRYNLRDAWVVVTDKVSGFESNRSTCHNIDASEDKIDHKFCQLWYIHYGGILVNACDNGQFAVTITGQYQGNYVKTQSNKKSTNQQFSFQFV